MVQLHFWMGGLMAACALFAQTEMSPEALLVDHIKPQMAAALQQVPDYTCTQTIERSEKKARGRKFEVRDALRMEVGSIDGDPVFAWPGAGNLEDREATDPTRPGAPPVADLSMQGRLVFVQDGPEYSYRGEAALDGRKTVRYDYDTPMINSQYRVRIAPNQAYVAYRGSFWADAATHDVVRLIITAYNIDPVLQVKSLENQIDYAKVKLGDATFSLPVSAVTTTVDNAGNTWREVTAISACRPYAAPSSASSKGAPEAAMPPVVKTEIPEGTQIEVALGADIVPAKAARGDEVFVRCSVPVKQGGRTLIPKGARLSGRITLLDRIYVESKVSYIIGLQFFMLEYDGVRTSVAAKVVRVPGADLRSMEVDHMALDPSGIDVPRLTAGAPVTEDRPPGWVPPAMGPEPGAIIVDGEHSMLRKGFPMTVRTEPVRSEERK